MAALGVRIARGSHLGGWIVGGMAVVLTVDVLMHTAAMWAVTTAPSGKHVSRRGILSRIGMVMFLLAMIDFFVLIFGIHAIHDARPYMELAFFVLILGLAVHAAQTGKYLEAICGTGGAARLGWWAKWIGRALCVGISTMAVPMVIDMALEIDIEEEFQMVIIGIVVAGGIIAFISLIGAIVVLFRFAAWAKQLAAMMEEVLHRCRSLICCTQRCAYAKTVQPLHSVLKIQHAKGFDYVSCDCRRRGGGGGGAVRHVESRSIDTLALGDVCHQYHGERFFWGGF